jgi:hypothetical protein
VRARHGPANQRPLSPLMASLTDSAEALRANMMSRSSTLLLAAAALAGLLALGAQLLPRAAPRIVDQLPPRQPGQWEVHRVIEMGTSPGISMPPFQICIDPATDGATIEFALTLRACSPDAKISGLGGGQWMVDEQCEIKSGVINKNDAARGVHSFITFKQSRTTTISGDFQTTFTVRRETKPGIATKPDVWVTTLAARWVGPSCAEGLVPGDIVHGMITFNPLRPWEGLKQVPPPADKPPPN